MLENGLVESKAGGELPLVLITGAAGSLGTGLVRRFVTGWRVAAGMHQTPLEFVHPNLVWSKPLNVRSGASVQTAVEGLEQAHGPIRVLINNAGLTRDGLLGQLPEEDWDEVLSANLKGAFLCSRAVMEGMKRQREGHIIHVGSFAGRAGAAGQANYAAAKAGLIGLMQSLAREGAPDNIRSNVILPGVMKSSMTMSLPPEKLERLTRANLLNRLNDVDEVAAFVVTLAGMRNVSGQVFQLDSRIVSWI